jgi:DNA-binding MarR family transcriptional regulator
VSANAPPPEQPAAGLDRALTYRLHLLHKLVDRASQLAYPQATGLTASDARCLGAVGAFGPLSVVELGRLAQLDKGQASRATRTLVDQGLIRKQADPQDARAVVLTLTAQGRQAYRRTLKLVARRNDEAFGCLSEREQAQLGRLLDRLIEHNQPDGN